MVGTAGGNDPDTGDIYLGWDRFGRVKDNYWYDYGSTTDVDRIKYGYDRAGNRIWRENTVAASYGKHFDELYEYDLIQRLKHMDRGGLNALKDAVTNLQFAQCWKLDETGNWSNFREDDDGDSSWDLAQSRTTNNVNEITNITETTGPSWVTPVYSKAGNMTTVPKPADPTVGFTCTYDAWNRLVKIEEGGDTVAEYEYDGAKRRVIKKVYSGGFLDETRHLYYTEPSRWQVVEERVDASSDPDRQFVWGLRYIDDIVVRDRDTTGDGSLDEQLYGLQDANWNVTGTCDSAGTMQERYAYSCYGVPSDLTPAFASRKGSGCDWETSYAGYRWDSTARFYHVRNRIFVPCLAWIQRDPLGLAADVQMYRYVSANPITRRDPTGRGVTCTRVGSPIPIGPWIVLPATAVSNPGEPVVSTNPVPISAGPATHLVCRRVRPVIYWVHCWKTWCYIRSYDWWTTEHDVEFQIQIIAVEGNPAFGVINVLDASLGVPDTPLGITLTSNIDPDDQSTANRACKENSEPTAWKESDE